MSNIFDITQIIEEGKMKRKHLKFWEAGLIFTGIMFLFSVKAIAVGTLISISSATYDGGNHEYAHGVAVDSEGNIIVTGHYYNGTNNDYMTVKYDPNFIFLSSAGYDGGSHDQACAVAIGSNGSIFVTGYSSNTGTGYDYFTIKYDQDLIVVSSVTYPGPNNDMARGVTIDNQGNVIITGSSGVIMSYDYFTVRYDSDLVLIDSVTYDGGNNEGAQGVAVDNQGNIIVTGTGGAIMSSDYFTIKYDPHLVVLSSVVYDSGGSDNAYAVDVNTAGDIIITGRSNDNYFTIKYNSDLVVLSSATYDGANTAVPYGMVVDNKDNIIVTGIKNYCAGDDYFTIKYNPYLVILSSAIYSRSNNGGARGVAVDSDDNIFVIGSFFGSTNDCFTIKYNGSPQISSLSPAYSKRGKTLDVTINGLNFYPGVGITFVGDGITVNSAVFVNSTQLQANITIIEDASLGMRNVTATNIDEVNGTILAGFEVKALEVIDVGVKIQGGEKGYVNPAKEEEAVIHFRANGAGEIKIKIYTLKGQLVCEKSKETDGEEDSIVWDCKNSDGTIVSSGIYILRINAPGINTTKRIAVLK
jgi:hypothetical protein